VLVSFSKSVLLLLKHLFLDIVNFVKSFWIVVAVGMSLCIGALGCFIINIIKDLLIGALGSVASFLGYAGIFRRMITTFSHS